MDDNKPKKTPGRPFEIGNTYSLGRIPKVITEAKKLRVRDFEKSISAHISLPMMEIRKIAEAGDTRGVDALVCNCIVVGVDNGDPRVLVALMRLMFGPEDTWSREIKSVPSIVIKKRNGDEVQMKVDKEEE